MELKGFVCEPARSAETNVAGHAEYSRPGRISGGEQFDNAIRITLGDRRRGGPGFSAPIWPAVELMVPFCAGEEEARDQLAVLVAALVDGFMAGLEANRA